VSQKTSCYYIALAFLPSNLVQGSTLWVWERSPFSILLFDCDLTLNNSKKTNLVCNVPHIFSEWKWTWRIQIQIPMFTLITVSYYFLVQCFGFKTGLIFNFEFWLGLKTLNNAKKLTWYGDVPDAFLEWKWKERIQIQIPLFTLVTTLYYCIMYIPIGSLLSPLDHPCRFI
jgi:hypothetical protein